jgi:fatty-acyl-CoA synthase
MDADGYLWVTGRAKDIIIRGGHNIDPQVTEESLYRHEAVQIAGAVGRPDDYAGEMPVAYVQLKEGANADAVALKAFARDNVAERAAAPSEVYILDAMPLTAIGKVNKRVLRMDAAKRHFEAAFADMGAGVVIAVEERAATGLTLVVTAIDAETGAEITNRLEPYAMAHEVNY